MTASVTIDPQAWGIVPEYHSVTGERVRASHVAVEAALTAMDAAGAEPPPTATWVVATGERVVLPAPATLFTEDGGSERVHEFVPPVEAGYHRLEFDDRIVNLIVSPGRCAIPERSWGWAMQLYAMRSTESWGIGDLADLAAFTKWSGTMGAQVVFVNPLHAAAPTTVQESSPYFPTSRVWRNPIYLRIEDVTGAELVPEAELAQLAANGRALNENRRIDRDRIWKLKRAALERIWERTGAGAGFRPEFDRWRDAAGTSLQRFAAYAALSERHGRDWRQWPSHLRSPEPAVAYASARAGQPGEDDALFHAWVQFLIDCQLGVARSAADGAGVSIVGDLAVGCDPGGAETWQDRDLFAEGVRVGAPPDEFAPGGQDWGFPPWDPWQLRAAGYRPFIELLRAAFRGCGGLRIDHVMGLFRLYWIPAGCSPAEGVYVRYPWQDLCRILALESQRHGAFVVGEDLGTVDPDVRAMLGQTGVLSTRLVWFEDDGPARWPELAMAAVTTHDLPTIAGLLSGSDAIVRRQEGLLVDEEAENLLRARLAAVAGDGEDVVESVYATLGQSPCRVVAVGIEDALAVIERPNLPGTDRPSNWSLALPERREDIEASPPVRSLARAMAMSRRNGHGAAGAGQ